ncbi:MAG: ABC transporter ATP-binding protein [Acidobacteria bacterium]|nr:ABC transporter ATP-binding protein [Acidobacteriota bacterium]
MPGSGVTFQHVWKRFSRSERHNALRDLVPAVFARAVSASSSLERDEFWALRDVSFEVRRGEALGIIGPNGAGKSTALKLLTRIMRPTKGVCELRGRIGALIEISAGFHQDLSGRENVFLQGAVMGMKRAEIARKFDEIVEFSGISEFIDTPVKRYSSGMNARLGFSIAAHLDPEVLIIDEVLSVGDYAFQQKAYDRIQEIASRDIIVVLVSHNLERVSQLCSQAILLSQGQAVQTGPVDDVIAGYVQVAGDSHSQTDSAPIRYDRLERTSLQDVPSGGWLTFTLSGTVLDAARVPETAGIGVVVRAMSSGSPLFSLNSNAIDAMIPASPTFVAEVELQMNVTPGMYRLQAVVRDRRTNRILQRGPWTSVKVSGTTVSTGIVQMNPRISFREPGSRQP